MLKLQIPVKRLNKFARFVKKTGGFKEGETPPYPTLFLIFFEASWSVLLKDKRALSLFVGEVKILCSKWKERNKKI